MDQEGQSVGDTAGLSAPRPLLCMHWCVCVYAHTCERACTVCASVHVCASCSSSN